VRQYAQAKNQGKTSSVLCRKPDQVSVRGAPSVVPGRGATVMSCAGDPAGPLPLAARRIALIIELLPAGTCRHSDSLI